MRQDDFLSLANISAVFRSRSKKLSLNCRKYFCQSLFEASLSLSLFRNDSTLPECFFNVNPSIFSITFFMGLIFATIFFINGLVIDAFGKHNLLVTILMLCGVLGIIMPYTINFYVVLICLVGFVASGVCGNILSSILVDLYETNTRAMALSVVFSFGRVGAVFGSMMVSLLIENKCKEMFWIFGGILIMSAGLAMFLIGKASNKLVKMKLFDV